jgi:FlaA1/EpsC-like NDP-sugar epimerase
MPTFEISPGLGVAIMMNNYFHDVATALMIASAFVLHVIVRIQAEMNTPVATVFFLKMYKQMVRFFRFSLWWIILGGVPRTIFYTSFEWNHFADKLQVPALMVKHVLMAAAVIYGIRAWRRLKVTVAELRESLPPEMRLEVE